MVESAIQSRLTTAPLPVAMANVSVRFGINPGENEGNPDNKRWIVHFRNGSDPHDTKSGRSTLDTVSYQVNIFAYTANDGRLLAIAVRHLLDRIPAGQYGANDVFIQSSRLTNEVSLFEFEDMYNGRGVYQVTQYYDIRTNPQYS